MTYQCTFLPSFLLIFLVQNGLFQKKAKQGVEGILFFNFYLAAQWLTLGHSQEDSLTNPMLITAFSNYFDRKVTGEPCNEVGSLSPVERLVGGLNQEPSNFNHNALRH